MKLTVLLSGNGHLRVTLEVSTAARVSASVGLAVGAIGLYSPRMRAGGLATLDAVLNLTAAVLLSLGFLFIRQRRIARHRACMLGAFGVSVGFLVTYIVHHLQVGSVPYRGHGAWRALYFAILIPHVMLAAAVVPLAVTTITRALRGRFVQHKRIARWTLPIWLYVSVSGVLVYLMLYH